ncbi:parallel beta-helix repeat protein [Bradyrhizobium sp. GM0.4]
MHWSKNISRTALVYLAAVLAIAPVSRGTSAESGSHTIYVDPDGNDDWSGSSLVPDGVGGGPLATPAKAIELIRRLKSMPGAPEGGYKVLLRGGTYYLSKPIVIRPEDSGTATAPNVFGAMPGENPVLSGGQRLTGWRVNTDGRWQIELPEVAQGGWTFAQLYAGEKRRVRARLPKQGYFRTVQELPPSPRAKGRGYDRFGYEEGNLRPDWHDLGAVEIKLLLNWSSASFHIENMNTADRAVQLSGSTRQRWYKIPIGTRFLVENVREALSAPGEFYVDRKSGVLTYLPGAGESVDRTIVIAPRLEHLLILTDAGNEQAGVQHIRFEGLTFANTNWELPPAGSTLSQSAIGMPAAVVAVGARNVVFENIVIRNTAGHALVLGPGCHFNRITNSQFRDLGAGGLLIGDAAVSGSQRALLERHGDSEVGENELMGNSISGTGRTDPAASGIWVGNSARNRIESNEIADTYYTGISVGWTWGYGESKARENAIINNQIHDIGQNTLSDLAGIYTLGVSPGTVIKGNSIVDVSAYSYGGFGIAMDEGSSEITVEENFVYRTSDAGLAINFGRDNVVRNNVFALGRNAQLAIGKGEPHRTLTFEGNVVYWNGADSLLHGPWLGANVQFDRNIYWNAMDTSGRQLSDSISMSGWRSQGRDIQSVWTDPGFSYLSAEGFRRAGAGVDSFSSFIRQKRN